MQRRIFFPGCRIKAGYPDASKKLSLYMKERYGLSAMGCCKVDHTALNDETTAVLICNNCTNDLHKNVEYFDVEYVYELIDNDDSFIFPDYHNRHFFLQHCHDGYSNHPIDRTVESILNKMHISCTAFEKEVPAGISSAEHRMISSANAMQCDEEIITYCARCNLAVKNAGKRTHFLLDLLFDSETE